MKVFLTGTGGFSGARMAAYLLESGHTVYGLSRRDVPLPGPLASSARMHVVRGDLATLAALPDGIEAIVHAAATSPVDETRIGQLIRDNVLATENLVELAVKAGVAKFFFFSSLSAYGTISGGTVDERSPVVDPGPYGASKLLGEFSLRERAGRMASLAVRLPAVVGRGASRHWLAGVVAKARRGQDIRIYNPSTPFNNAVHIDNLAELLNGWLAMHVEGFDFITLASSGALPVGNVVQRVVAAIGSASKIVVEPSASQSFLVSSRRAIDVYGFRPHDIGTTLDLYLGEALS
jgi:nucleoside-diphosphate-sugar epimerase